MFAIITLINLEKPVMARKSRLEVYRFSPVEPGVKSRFFYAQSAQKEIEAAEFGAGFRLRFEHANDALRGDRLSRIKGYFGNVDAQDDLIIPVIARLPRSRGFLSGWSMGGGMASGLDMTLWENEFDAARYAHQLAEEIAEEMARQDEEAA